MALDRDALGKSVFQGKYESVIFVPRSIGKWAMRVSDLPPDTQRYYAYNPAEAKKLIDAAGAGGLQLNLASIINGPSSLAPTPAYKLQTESIANMLSAVGLRIALVSQDYNKDYIDAGRGSRQGFFGKDTIIFAGAGGGEDADTFLFGYFHSKSTTNQEHLSDPTMDAMIDRERTLVDEGERLKAIQEIEQYVADKMYAVNTVQGFISLLVNPRVQNYQFSTTLGRNTETYAKAWIRA
jgi:peptide/nickel transport system substrate-binding protein